MNAGRVVSIGRCDTLPVCVQSPAWWNGQEGSRDDRLALIGSKQLWIRGTAALERYADSAATDAGATLALAATSLRHPRVSQVWDIIPQDLFSMQPSKRGMDFTSSACRISWEIRARFWGRVTACTVQIYLERDLDSFFFLISRSETIVYCPVEQRKSIFQSICQS